MNKKTFLACVLMMSLLLLQNVDALENINKCQTLNVENEHYYLNESIIDNSGAGKCIEITAKNITLDCGDNVIDGTGKSNTYGIYSNQNMTTIKNCIVSDWNNGIVFYNANNGTIHNNEPYSNKASGILLKESKYNVLSDNNASYNQYGIKLNDNSNENEIKNNIATYNKINGIYVESNCFSNLIYNNYLAGNNHDGKDAGNGNNFWNTTNSTGPNIIGGPYIGGNYYSDYDGVDENGDGFGETPYDNIGGQNRDYLPLVIPEFPAMFLSVGLMFLSLFARRNLI